MRYGVNTDYAIVGQHPYDPDRVILPEIMKENGYTTGMFGKWAGGYEGSVSTPDKRGIDEFFGYICQFQAHLYYPNFLNRYSSLLGDTATIRVTLEENIKYPMWGAVMLYGSIFGRSCSRSCNRLVGSSVGRQTFLRFFHLHITSCRIGTARRFPSKLLSRTVGGNRCV